MKANFASSLTLLAIALSVTTALAQDSTAACTDETAYQTLGKWGRQKKDDVAMADKSFPIAHHKAVLSKAQKVIDLFKLASPEFKGIEASAKRDIRGDSYVPGGALPFGIEIHYGRYICVENNSPKIEARGKVILSGGYGHTTVYFNSLRDVLESVQDGGAFVTTEGDEIFEYKKHVGEFKGFTMIEPRIRDIGHEAIIITPDNRLPYKAVTREQYLNARMKNYQALGGFAREIDAINLAIRNMTPAERQQAAIVRDITASPGRAKLFVSEAEGGRHLVVVDKTFFNSKLPRDAIQFMTVRWNLNDAHKPKADVIRNFKQAFDFVGLKQMLGR